MSGIDGRTDTSRLAAEAARAAADAWRSPERRAADLVSVLSPALASANAAAVDAVERAADYGPFGARPSPPMDASRPAAPAPPRSPKAVAWSDAVREVVGPGVARTEAQIERLSTSVARARKALVLPPEASLLVRYGSRLAEKRLGPLEARITAARERLEREVAPAGPRFWDGIEGARTELAQVRQGLGQAHEALGEIVGRAAPGGVRSALSDMQQAERAAAAADAELRMLHGRAGALSAAPAPEAAAAPAASTALTEEDLARIGAGLDPGKPPVQTLWNENMVNLLASEGRRQGGLSEAQGGRNAELARLLLSPEGEADGARREASAADVAAALKAAGEPPLERIDPGQLAAAARYLNTATSLADQQEKLRKVLDNFQVLDRIGLPKLPRAELMGQLELHARVPGKATSKLKDAELLAKFQEIAATLNGGGELRTKVGKHKLELQVSQDGQILKAKCKKPSFWSKVGGFLKKALPVVLTVASFIPVTAPFARVASAVMSAVQAVKAKSVLGIAGAAAGMVGAGVAAFAGKAASVAGTAANRIATIANAASRTLHAAQAVRQGSVLGGLAGVAGALASGVSSVAGSFGQGFGRIADGLDRWAGRAAAGLLAADAAKRGDLFGAVGLGASLASDFTGAKADKWLSRVADGATRAGAAEWAIRRGDYLGAASSLSGLAAGYAGGAGRELERTAATLGQLGLAQRLVKGNDYLGAASALTAAAGSYVGSAPTRERLDEVAGQLMRAGQAHVRAARGDYLGASEALTRLASGFGWDDQTKGQLGRAADVFQRATGIEGALKSGDYLGASALLAQVGTLFVGEPKLGFTGASDLLQRVAPAYDLMRRGDFSGAAEILTPLALDGRLWPFGSRSPLQGTTELTQALSGMRTALQSGDYAKAARALGVVRLADSAGQETLRQVQAALEAMGRVKGGLEAGDWQRAGRAASELLRYEHLLSGTPLGPALRALHQAVEGSDPQRLQSAAVALGQALGRGASELLRPLQGVLQTEARGALGEQVRALTNPAAVPWLAMGVAGVGAASRVVDPVKLARELSPDVARRLGLPWPLDADKLTPEQVAKLRELGQDKGFLEQVKDSVKSWTWSDVGHTGLDVVGFVPGLGEAADVANAAWYVAEAKYLDAGLSLISVIPVVGDVIGKGGKLAKRLGGDAAQKVLQALQRVDVVRFLDQFKTHPKLGPYVAQIQEAVGKWVDELKGSGASPAKPTALPDAGTMTKLNRVGVVYPSIIDPRTARPIAFPDGDLARVTKADRVTWGLKERGEFIAEWHRRGLPTPPGGWARYDIHHIRPREFGGRNDFENLVPVERTVDHQQFNRFWEKY